MYTKDKSQRITLRLNEEQFNYVKASSDLLGVSPSDFLRMVINVTMASEKKLNEKFGNTGLKNEQEGVRRENEESNHNYIV